MAGAELAMLFELSENRAFRWLEEEFLNKPFQEARETFLSPDTRGEDLPAARHRYLALKEVKKAPIEREIVHRKLLDPGDSEIFRLQMKLGAL